MLLIITNARDLAADYLILALEEHDLPFYRLNSEDLNETEFLFQLGGDDARLIRCQGKEVHLETVTSVWYRRAVLPPLNDRVAPEQRQFVRGEMRHLVEGLVLDDTPIWVNPIDSTNKAERKLYQLRCAKQCGLEVPSTIVSNRKPDLITFLPRHESSIIKPIFHGLLRYGLDASAIYTRPAETDDFADEESIKVCPVYLQQEVKRGVDIRLTIVGKHVFPVSITPKTAEPRVDWRVPGTPLNYAVCELPDSVLSSCRALMRKLNLVYGAIDFIVTQDGNWVFLEINPAGEWAWLEHQLDIPIRRAFIDVFFHDGTRGCKDVVL